MKTPEYQLEAEMAQILNDVTKKIGRKKPTKERFDQPNYSHNEAILLAKKNNIKIPDSL
jgi:hypothetical protein